MASKLQQAIDHIIIWSLDKYVSCAKLLTLWWSALQVQNKRWKDGLSCHLGVTIGYTLFNSIGNIFKDEKVLLKSFHCLPLEVV